MTHLRPAMTAEAGFVPWADTGMRHTLRCPSPIDCWYALIANSPAYSPEAPESGEYAGLLAIRAYQQS